MAAGGNVEGLVPEAEKRLLAHTWPGNVRELRNVVERAVILQQSGPITAENLVIDGAPADQAGGANLPVPEDDFSLETAERLFITRALRETGWQRTRAAALLGITRATLHAKLKRYKIEIPDGSHSPSSSQAERPSASRLAAAGV